jgi:DNA-nicking Smr family endonuclease
MSRRRSLSDEEEALWSGYVRAITPLRPGKAKPAHKPTAAVTRVQASQPAARGEVKQPLSRPQAKPLPLAPIDRRFKQRVARGRDEIEARIDLHGMTQREAHAALFQFLRRAQTDGMRIALVVTGKGTTARDATSERGVLRRQVPLWLALPEFRPFIVGFDEAHVSHGGQGALYVRLRRAR